MTISLKELQAEDERLRQRYEVLCVEREDAKEQEARASFGAFEAHARVQQVVEEIRLIGELIKSRRQS